MGPVLVFNDVLGQTTISQLYQRGFNYSGILLRPLAVDEALHNLDAFKSSDLQFEQEEGFLETPNLVLSFHASSVYYVRDYFLTLGLHAGIEDFANMKKAVQNSCRVHPGEFLPNSGQISSVFGSPFGILRGGAKAISISNFSKSFRICNGSQLLLKLLEDCTSSDDLERILMVLNSAIVNDRISYDHFKRCNGFQCLAHLLPKKSAFLTQRCFAILFAIAESRRTAFDLVVDLHSKNPSHFLAADAFSMSDSFDMDVASSFIKLPDRSPGHILKPVHDSLILKIEILQEVLLKFRIWSSSAVDRFAHSICSILSSSLPMSPQILNVMDSVGSKKPMPTVHWNGFVLLNLGIIRNLLWLALQRDLSKITQSAIIKLLKVSSVHQ